MSVHQCPFRIVEIDLDRECREMRVEGELDLSVADQFQTRLDAAAKEDVEVLVCLERCDFIDSTGIAAIVLSHKLMASRGRRLLVCNPSRQVSRILAVTGLNDVGLVYASTDAALAERFGHAVARPFRAEESSLQELGSAGPGVGLRQSAPAG